MRTLAVPRTLPSRLDDRSRNCGPSTQPFGYSVPPARSYADGMQTYKGS